MNFFFSNKQNIYNGWSLAYESLGLFVIHERLHFIKSEIYPEHRINKPN